MNESTLVPREEISDLDWLARALHKWPDGDGITLLGRGCSFFDTGVGRSVHVYAVDGSDYTTIKEKDWLARRAELQNKPSWDDFGESAKFMAQDSDGAWMAFESEPAANYHVWSSMRGWCGYAREGRDRCRGEVLGDWRDTLEKRPADLSGQAVTSRLQEATNNVLAAAPELMTDKYKFEPFVSVEDEQQELGELEMLAKVSHLISDKRHRKQLTPFASVEDVKFSMLQSDESAKDSGGLIDRFILVKEDAATAKQPAPKGSGNPILGMVLADLTSRALEGKEKYGEPLLAYNGRNPLWDAYQEALDLAMYLRQAIDEQK